LQLENVRLRKALTQLTERYRLLTERTEKLETRYTRLRTLLTDSLSTPTENETATWIATTTVGGES
jgi:hypothetical protein